MENKLCLYLAAVAMVLQTTAGQDATPPPPKPFGIGHGPAYIGGRDTDANGTKIALEVYSQYRQYKKINGQVENEDYYKRWTDRDECIGGCGGSSTCDDGICICNHWDGYVQAYGRCWGEKSAVFLSDTEKYRKPTPPPKPTWCYCEKKNGHREICDQHRNKEECRDVHYPNEFDPNTQFCSRGDHQFCHSKDTNMYCSGNTMLDPTDNVEKYLCQCRPDMKFDTRNMECRIFIDVDCTYTEKRDLGSESEPTETSSASTLKEIVAALKGQGPIKPTFDTHSANLAFCNLIDSEAEEYNAHLVGDFTIYGLTAGGLALTALISCLTCCCCCKCCQSVRDKIRRLDPRNMIKNQGQGLPTTEMAALGVVAAGEYMANKEEQNDEKRLAAMQGGMPQAPGYVPVPQGYPQGGMPYPPASGQSPYPGYGPVPTNYPAAGPGGYIPPENQGMLGTVMGVAPEMALAGAGAFTGNNAMLAMGAVAAAEKVGMDEDKEDRFRAAAIRGVPPPPMGYPGGQQPVYPQQNQLPPAAANYPRQGQ